jgi:hypothetical protein
MSFAPKIHQIILHLQVLIGNMQLVRTRIFTPQKAGGNFPQDIKLSAPVGEWFVADCREEAGDGYRVCGSQKNLISYLYPCSQVGEQLAYFNGRLRDIQSTNKNTMLVLK